MELHDKLTTVVSRRIVWKSVIDERQRFRGYPGRVLEMESLLGVVGGCVSVAAVLGRRSQGVLCVFECTGIHIAVFS